jgi:hypothetical protein
MGFLLSTHTICQTSEQKKVRKLLVTVKFTMVILTRYLYVCKKGAIKAIVVSLGLKLNFFSLFFRAGPIVNYEKSTEQSQFSSAPGISLLPFDYGPGENRK